MSRYPGSVYNAQGMYVESIINATDLSMGTRRIPRKDRQPRIIPQPGKIPPSKKMELKLESELLWSSGSYNCTELQKAQLWMKIVDGIGLSKMNPHITQN